MALGPSTALVNGWLDALCRNVSFTVPTLWIQLHVAEPGPGGVTAPAVETSRKQVTFAAATGGSIANNAAVTWTGIAASPTQDATHFSMWSASSGGTFYGSGAITANAYSAGDSYTVGAGGFTISMPVAT